MMIKLTLVLQLCIVLLFALVGCTSRDTFYDYGQTTFVSRAGSSRIGEVQFNSSSQAADDIYVRVPSEKVLPFRDITTEDVGGYRLDGGDGRVECVTGTFRFYFVDGKLDFANGRTYQNCEFSFSRSKAGPFVTLPMSVQQLRQSIGTPQKISSRQTSLR